MSSLTNSQHWQRLADHKREFSGVSLRSLFATNPHRTEQFVLRAGDFTVDFSKNFITDKTLELLFDLAQARNVPAVRDQMFRGEIINTTEKRAVLHTALRTRAGSAITVDGVDVMPAIGAVLDKMRQFSQSVRSGQLTGWSGKKIKNIVNIGIGGSDLGPVMAYEALRFYSDRSLTFRFISNVDGTHVYESLRDLEADETLFIVASKTFTTDETMTNAQSCKAWFLAAAKDESFVKKHFVALSTNTDEVVKFGIAKESMFAFWDFVGGRFSLPSAIGLSLMIAIGPENFDQLLDGYARIDQHFRVSPLEKNVPVILALLEIWYNNFWQSHAHAIFPYDQYLVRFPAYLQQAFMESNGKSVTKEGEFVDYQTGSIVFGEPGTNGQHAFYQLLHQGTKCIPIDFIAFAKNHHGMDQHHKKLLANCFAQSEALAFGLTEEELRKNNEDEAVIPHKIMQGNHPSTTLLAPLLCPNSLGQLVALYEHMIFVEGVIWGINSFDQYGVELGKKLASRVLQDLKTGTTTARDSSTNLLVQTALALSS